MMALKIIASGSPYLAVASRIWQSKESTLTPVCCAPRPVWRGSESHAAAPPAPVPPTPPPPQAESERESNISPLPKRAPRVTLVLIGRGYHDRRARLHVDSGRLHAGRRCSTAPVQEGRGAAIA